MVNEFPGNSRNEGRPAQPEGERQPPKLEPVVTGKVVRRKKGLGRRVFENLFAGSDGILSHLGQNIFIPAAQALVADVVTQVTDSVRQGVEVAIWGQARTPQRGPVRGPGGIIRNTHTNYNQPSTIMSRTGSMSPPTPPRRAPLSQPSAWDLEDIVLPTEFEAKMVVEELYETLREYGTVSVANLRELMRESPLPTENNWGWKEGAEFGIRRVGRDGWRVVYSTIEDLR